MRKRAKILLMFVGLGLLSLYLATSALAAPSAPVNVVNHKTRQCAMMGRGDECQTCVPTGDWEILDGDCPEGYTQLADFAPNSCAYNGNTISMCDYVKYSGFTKNIKPFLIGVVIIVLILVILYYVEKRKGVLR
jgi:hypothetical protein